MSFTPDVVPTIFSYKKNSRGSFIIEDYCTGEKTICKPITILKQTQKQLMKFCKGIKISPESDSEEEEIEIKPLKSPDDSTIMKRRSLDMSSGR